MNSKATAEAQRPRRSQRRSLPDQHTSVRLSAVTHVDLCVLSGLCASAVALNWNP